MDFQTANHRSTPSVEYVEAPSRDDLKQKQLAKHCYWQEFDQILWVDARQLYPEIGVLKLLSWEAILMDSQPVPEYPDFLKPLDWPKVAEVAAWSKLIPRWVAESCRLFPNHQLKLLHYVGKYPQILELLDHAPYLAWRLVTSSLQEPEIVALLGGKRQQIVEQLGWPGLKETLKFLQNLRLRQVTPMIIEQVETCALDPKRLSDLQNLPRINSMALTLASRFPEMIGCRLHLSLAKQPCQPMQCQMMVSLLEDAFQLIEQLQLGDKAINDIRQSLYLSDVHQLYLQWMRQALVDCSMMQTIAPLLVEEQSLVSQWSHVAAQQLECFVASLQLSPEPKALTNIEDWQALSLLQEHAWWLDYDSDKQLYVWQESASDKSLPAGRHGEQTLAHFKHSSVRGSKLDLQPNLWAALVDTQLLTPQEPVKILRIRGLENRLPQSKQLSAIHLFLLRQFPQTTE